MILAVLDTNVLVSALISRLGNEALILLALKQAMFCPCYSRQILDEYDGVLRRRKFQFAPDEVDGLIEMVRNRGRCFDPSLVDLSPDSGDNKFIACALAARAEFLITGNKRHFPPAALSPASVVSAGEFLELLLLA